MVTTTTADKVLKSYYLDTVSEQLDLRINPFFAKIKKSTSDVWGKDVRKVVRYGVNGGIGAGSETGDLPVSGGDNYETFVAPLKNLYGTIEISDKALRASAGNEGAFINLLNDEMEHLVRSASFNFGRMLFGDGSGVLTKIVSGSNGVYSVNRSLYLFEGMIVDLYSSAGVKLAAQRTVLKVDRPANEVTISGTTVANIAGGFITVQNSYNQELTGLDSIFSKSTSLYGVSRADKNWMTPISESMSGVKLTEEGVQLVIDTLEEMSNSKVDLIITTWEIKRMLAKELAQKRVYDSVKLEGGYQALSFNGIPVVADRFCPSGTMYFLNTDDFCLHQLCDWQWLEGDDGKILKQKPGQAVYSATLVKYAELICTRPCGQAKITDIVDTVDDTDNNAS